MSRCFKNLFHPQHFFQHLHRAIFADNLVKKNLAEYDLARFFGAVRSDAGDHLATVNLEVDFIGFHGNLFLISFKSNSMIVKIQNNAVSKLNNTLAIDTIKTKKAKCNMSDKNFFISFHPS